MQLPAPVGWQLVDIEIVENFVSVISKYINTLQLVSSQNRVFKHDTHQDEPVESYITDLLLRSDTFHNLCKSVK